MRGGVAIAVAVALSAAATPAVAQTWSVLGDAHVRVVYATGDSLRAVETLGWARAQPPLPGIPDSFPAGIRIILAPTEAAWDSITSGVAPEWSVGVARPGLDEMVIPTFVSGRNWFSDDAGTLRHEWAHLGLHQYLGGLRIPRWFDEGYAERAAGSWDEEAAWRLRVAIALGSVPPLDSLELGWPRDRAAAQNAYFLSATALEALEGEAGERGLALFLEDWKATSSFDGALGRIYGHTTASLERAWKEHLKERYNWVWVVTRVLAGWTLLAVVVLLMVGFRGRRRRTSMAGLRARDPEDPIEPEEWEWTTSPAGDVSDEGRRPADPNLPPEGG